MASLESSAKKLTAFLGVYRFVGPLLSLLSGFAVTAGQSPASSFVSGAITAVVLYFLNTWSAEWVARSSRAVLQGQTDNSGRPRALCDTLNRWNTASQWLLIVGGGLGVLGLLIAGLAGGSWFVFIALALIPALILSYLVIGWWKKWLEDATARVERGDAPYTIVTLSDSLSRWYLFAIVAGVVSLLFAFFLPGQTGFSLVISLVSGALGLTLTWFWREFFTAFTARALMAAPAAIGVVAGP
jgi:hypothetical protein